MQSKNAPVKLPPLQTTLAILLTLAGGYVDAIGFLRLNGIYVANMSGNSVAIGIHSARFDWPTVLERLLPVACYVAGLVGTRILVNFAQLIRFRRVAAASLALEVCALVLFMRSTGLNSGIVFATVAMGIQAATVTRFNGVTVHTAFVTGSLIKFAERFSEWVVAPPGVNRENGTEARSRAAKDAIWFFSVWVAYIVGAACGAALLDAAGKRVILLACILIGALAIPDLFHPMEFDTRT